jgi:predicted NACHT family NTPase
MSKFTTLQIIKKLSDDEIKFFKSWSGKNVQALKLFIDQQLPNHKLIINLTKNAEWVATKEGIRGSYYHGKDPVELYLTCLEAYNKDLPSSPPDVINRMVSDR